MCIEERSNHSGVVWTLVGRLTGEASEALAKAVGRAASCGCRRIVIDLADVSMVDAGGLGALVTVYRLATASLIALSLVRVPSRVRHLLAITRLTSVLPIGESADEAPSTGAREGMRRTDGLNAMQLTLN